jgi:hypothetical protein
LNRGARGIARSRGKCPVFSDARLRHEREGDPPPQPARYPRILTPAPAGGMGATGGGGGRGSRGFAFR